MLDEARRAEGLRPLRDRNNTEEIRLLSRLRPIRGLHVLDVGAGHGWFLEAAVLAGARAEGLEPDEAIAESARARGLGVTTGYFTVLGNGHYITVDFYAWTPHTLTFTGLTSKFAPLPTPTVVAMGSVNLTSMGGGTVTLVSPSKTRAVKLAASVKVKLRSARNGPASTGACGSAGAARPSVSRSAFQATVLGRR